MSIFTKIFGDPNEKVVKKIEPLVEEINKLEPKFEAFSNEELKNQTQIFKKFFKEGRTLDNILPEAFAVVREATKRTLKMRHYDVQLIGGVVLHRGQVTEMKTGEGKTLMATLPLYLNALSGQGAHLVTVNDYLARRDVGWMGPIFYFLGLSSAAIVHEAAYIYDPEYTNENSVDEKTKYLRPLNRKEAYEADITYGTNNEFGFDYLRDNMVQSREQMVQRPLHFAIVDEVDSILIDEARTPLIISASAEESTSKYYQFSQIVKILKENEDYNIDEKMRAATLTEVGIEKVEKKLGVDNIYTEGGVSEVHHLEQALRAESLFKKDRDYVVKEGEIVIVDEFTGRLMNGRRYSEGLHQAIEAKEGVDIKRESRTLATITFQNYFRLYEKLAGMTGTAVTAAEELSKIYNLEVTVIPTNKPMIRKDLRDRIYKNEEAKFKAVAKEVKSRSEKGQPVLLGTISIEKNELLSHYLELEGVVHQVLNAKQHEREAQILTEAGRAGAVTVATNMAGRGVDILLGGPKKGESEEDLKLWQKEHEKVLKAGGLHVIGTERHEARRIDDQLRGRAGRQGDPGSSQFYVSMEDDLMRIFAGDRMKSLMEKLRVPDDMPIENGMVSRSIESAQTKVEGHNFDIRKHLVDYDDVMNKHREAIYKKRREILTLAEKGIKEKDQENVDQIKIDQEKEKEESDLKEKIIGMVEQEVEQVVSFHTAEEEEDKWNLEEIYEVINTIFSVQSEVRLKLEDIKEKLAGDAPQDTVARTKIIYYLLDLARAAYEEQEKKINEGLGKPTAMREIEKGISLRAIDTLWIEHLSAIDHLRMGIGLRGYAQRDPLVEYKKEAFRLFTELMNLINKQIVYSIYKVGLAQNMAPSVMDKKNIQLIAPKKTMEKGSNQFREITSGGAMAREAESREAKDKVPDKIRNEAGHKVGRNDPCPCGSGKKYKKCHGV